MLRSGSSALFSSTVLPGARHDVAADIVHLHAHTRRYWVSSTDMAHAGLKADPIPVRENEVNSWGIGAEGASERVVANVEKQYKPGRGVVENNHSPTLHLIPLLLASV